MQIELHNIPIRDLVGGYKDNSESGVVGYGGRLDIRPSFQREFVYKDHQRDAVIRTVVNKFPLNVMYWVKNPNDKYELLDGQQRTLSICQYIDGKFCIDNRYFHNLTEPEKNKILDYELTIYFCEGDDKEKLDWFRVINTVGEKLTEQELRNVVYTGEWLVDVKRRFSKTGCPAYVIAEKYLTGTAIRQDYLETAICWVALRDGSTIEGYMAKHQPDPNASDLWVYFQSVIDWIKRTFPTYRREMKGLDWGILYNQYKNNEYDPALLETQIVKLIEDDEVNNKRGIYEFLLSGGINRSTLGLRLFNKKTIAKKYDQQNGVCPLCDPTKHYDAEEMEADHIIPWSQGGETTEENCRMLCRHHNRTKSGE